MCPVKVRAPSGKTTRETPSFNESFACRMVSKTFFTGTVYKDMSCAFTGFSDEWQFTQTFFHHPFKVSSNEAVDEENIK